MGLFWNIKPLHKSEREALVSLPTILKIEFLHEIPSLQHAIISNTNDHRPGRLFSPLLWDLWNVLEMWNHVLDELVFSIFPVYSVNQKRHHSKVWKTHSDEGKAAHESRKKARRRRGGLWRVPSRKRPEICRCSQNVCSPPHPLAKSLFTPFFLLVSQNTAQHKTD